MGLLPTWFLDSVVAIGEIDAAGTKKFFATGFFYGIRTGDPVPEGANANYHVFLITNRHVADRIGNTAIIRLNQRDKPTSLDFPTAARTPTGWPTFVSHPDPEIDVAATTISINALNAHGIQLCFFQNDDHAATLAQMRDEFGVADGDGIYVLGFPMGLVNDARTSVIARGGIVARIRDTYAGNSKTFLVDASVFPGNSGGPVILRPEGLAVPGTKAQMSTLLIGIVDSYMLYEETAYTPDGRPRVAFVENSGLAVAHSVDAIEETIAHLKKRQDEWGGRVAPAEAPGQGDLTSASPDYFLGWKCEKGHENKTAMTFAQQEEEMVTLHCSTPGCTGSVTIHSKNRPGPTEKP